jgi:hypothetical protein
MEKGFGFLVTLITCASVGLLVVACDDEKEPSEFGGEGVDASTDGPPVFGGSSSGGTSSSGGASGEGGTPGAKCEPTIASNYAASWTPPTAPASPGPCTTTTVGSYYDECLATLGKGDHKTRCDAWNAANTACGQCIEPTNQSGPIQWHRSRFYYTLNVAGCIAIQQNAFANTDCGYAFGASVNCNRDACSGCFETGSSTFDDFTNCQNAAKMVGLCQTLNTQAGTECLGDLQTADPTKGCFRAVGTPSEEPKVHFTRVMGYFCAKP